MDRHYAAIGKVALSWAAFEQMISYAIWTLADIDPSGGACITAQVINSDRLLNAVSALLHLKGATDKMLKPLDKFIGDCILDVPAI